jgi:O-antigen/teichoic acid export membrane protein
MAALPMGIAGLCQQTYFYVDNLFVRAQLGSEPLGHYNVAVRVMSYGIMVAVYAPLAALPWLTREHEEGHLAAAVTRLAQPLFALAGFAIGLVWPWCEALLALFGADFVSAADSLRYLLLACLAVYIGASLLTAVVASGRSRDVLYVALAGLAINLIGNTLLVPSFGMQGAAMATFATEAIVALGALWCLQRAGVKVFPGPHPSRWLAGPVALLIARALSAQLPIP